MNHSLIGQHPCMMRLRDTLVRYARLSLPILLLGESGCGKEIAARDYLHAQSVRQNAPWLAINCASLSPELLESTLFGHKKGAFTGAHQDHDGYFTQAANGTLFLDEVGDLPLALQVKLLRVLENGEYHRLGDTTPRNTKARIIAATNRDLRAMILAGQFREDLYHRLNVLSIRIPPLSARGNDRWLLLEHFTEQISTQHGMTPIMLTPEARVLWSTYTFPGNVRELRNILYRLHAAYPGQQISRAMLSEELTPEHTRDNNLPAPEQVLDDWARAYLQANPKLDLDAILARWQRSLIDAALHENSGNVSRAASRLGLRRTTLYSRLT